MVRRLLGGRPLLDYALKQLRRSRDRSAQTPAVSVMAPTLPLSCLLAPTFRLAARPRSAPEAA
jgi:hypothetical protein